VNTIKLEHIYFRSLLIKNVVYVFYVVYVSKFTIHGIQIFKSNSYNAELSEIIEVIIKISLHSIAISCLVNILVLPLILWVFSNIKPTQCVRIISMSARQMSYAIGSCRERAFFGRAGRAFSEDKNDEAFDETVRIQVFPFYNILGILVLLPPAAILFGREAYSVIETPVSSFPKFMYIIVSLIIIFSSTAILVGHGFTKTVGLLCNPRSVVFFGFGRIKVYRPGRDGLVVRPAMRTSKWCRVLFYSRRFGVMSMRVRVADAHFLLALWAYRESRYLPRRARKEQDAQARMLYAGACTATSKKS